MNLRGQRGDFFLQIQISLRCVLNSWGRKSNKYGVVANIQLWNLRVEQARGKCFLIRISRLIYANRKFYVIESDMKGYWKHHFLLHKRHVYGLISLYLTPIKGYKLPIIAYLLRQELSGRVCKIWKLNSDCLTNETCFLLALYHWLPLLFTVWLENM